MSYLLVAESFSEKIILQLFVFFNALICLGGCYRSVVKICDLYQHVLIPKQESVNATCSSSQPLLLLHPGSVFTENRLSVISQRHHLSFIVERRSFHHSLGDTNHWHVYLKKEKKENASRPNVFFHSHS